MIVTYKIEFLKNRVRLGDKLFINNFKNGWYKVIAHFPCLWTSFFDLYVSYTPAPPIGLQGAVLN